MAPRGQRIDGALIGRLRTQKLGITQAELASRLGIHWVTQSNIENGKALVSLELVERIAKETGASRDEILGVAKPEPDDESEPDLSALDGLSRDDYALYGMLTARIVRAKTLTERLVESEGSVVPTVLVSALAFVLLATGWSVA